VYGEAKVILLELSVVKLEERLPLDIVVVVIFAVVLIKKYLL
jgi:hypothetical protein